MVERGGPTTYAGIHYHNSVAALCLGDLLRWDVVNPSEQVVEARLEAPSMSMTRRHPLQLPAVG